MLLFNRTPVETCVRHLANGRIGAMNSHVKNRIVFVICILQLIGCASTLLWGASSENNENQNKIQSVPEVKLISVKRIWSDAPHNAFTSLIWFHRMWYCTFREAASHSVGAIGRIRVLASDNGSNWQSVAILGDAGVDLRDPHLSVTPKNQLMLLMCQVVLSNGVARHLSATRFSKNGTYWTKPCIVGDPDFWLWSATWHKGVCYAIGYNTRKENKVRLYRSADGRDFQTLALDLGVRNYPNESSIAFAPDDTAYCLLRASGPSYFGISKPPYTDWNWVKTGVPVGGPNMIRLPDGSWLAAGRRHSKDGAKTTLWWVDPNVGRLTAALDLPSGGDCGYPSMVWHNGFVWVSYYSSHEGRTSIYFAKVSVSDLIGYHGK